MQTSIYAFLIAIFCYSNNILCLTSTKHSCALSEYGGCLKEISNNVIDTLTRPQQTVHYHLGPRDCSEIRENGVTKSGIYRIWPLNWHISGSFLVYCDMEIDGGGWTIFQRRGRFNHSEDYFFRNWIDYNVGFGNLNEDFWLGNERIFSLTNQGNYTLRIDMKDNENNKAYALYREFWIENERQQYKIHVSDYSGDAGDSLGGHNNMKFSTKDRDNDIAGGNCAETYKGAWWYSSCHSSNLNGLYLNGPHKSYADGVIWKEWKGYHYSIPDVEMKIRRF
ncbi:techylectin-5A-like [Centruroides sculpturatus]|uniref:techylectin-5A-like n=1 Tax=Centruroides sculpturatus TaxID=218467 RepID=UPI000C6D957B|nr:techylectin-5A-like [Centruroides sculpturatus]